MPLPGQEILLEICHLKKKKKWSQVVVAHTSNSSTLETEAENP
jgi:hypothetical protein